MTIQFNCPHCGALIAFDKKHEGRRAQCLTCGQLFIIPSADYEKPQKIKSKVERAEPLPGFYRAAFVDNWKLFVRPQNATGLVFVVAAVCFKFFVGHTDYSFTVGAFRVQAPVGLIVSLTAWGCLFWYYMEIIYSTALNNQELPDVYMGGLFGFIWNVVKSLFIFAAALVAVELPCIIFVGISINIGTEWPLVSHLLALAGLFAFPIAILTLSVGRDIALLRPDHILKPIGKAFGAYITVFGVFALAWELQLCTVEYGELLGRSKIVVGLNLLANITVQALILIAMRSIGLFYRHYSCYFAW